MSNLCCQRFYEVVPDDERYPDQWFLGAPHTGTKAEIDPREFADGRPYRGAAPATVPINNPGRELRFSFGSFNMPVVSVEVARLLTEVAPSDVECFPIGIAGSQGRYEILNVTACLDCLDEEQSEFTRWTLEDSRPDLAGQYHIISTIRVDPRRTDGHHLFRIKEFTIALLVSQKAKEAMEKIPGLGVVFKSVT